MRHGKRNSTVDLQEKGQTPNTSANIFTRFSQPLCDFGSFRGEEQALGVSIFAVSHVTVIAAYGLIFRAMSVAKTLMSNTFIVFIIKSTIDLPECLMQHFRKLLYFQGLGASAWRSAAELSTCLVEKRENFRQIKTHDNLHKTRGKQAKKYLKK